MHTMVLMCMRMHFLQLHFCLFTVFTIQPRSHFMRLCQVKEWWFLHKVYVQRKRISLCKRITFKTFFQQRRRTRYGMKTPVICISRQSMHQPPRIRMCRMIIYFLRHACLYDLSRIHDSDPVSHTRHNTQIMRYKKDPHSCLVTNICKNIQYFSLNCSIQSRCRFISDQQRRIIGKSHRQYASLTHSARQHPRTNVISFICPVYSDKFHQFNYPAFNIRLRYPFIMRSDSFSDLTAYRVCRIKTGHWVLKNHGGFISPDTAIFIICQTYEFFSFDFDAAFRHSAGGVQQTHDGPAHHAFPTAGFSDNGKNLSPLYLQGEVSDSTYFFLTGIEYYG